MPILDVFIRFLGTGLYVYKNRVAAMTGTLQVIGSFMCYSFLSSQNPSVLCRFLFVGVAFRLSPSSSILIHTSSTLIGVGLSLK